MHYVPCFLTNLVSASIIADKGVYFDTQHEYLHTNRVTKYYALRNGCYYLLENNKTTIPTAAGPKSATPKLNSKGAFLAGKGVSKTPTTETRIVPGTKARSLPPADATILSPKESESTLLATESKIMLLITETIESSIALSDTETRAMPTIETTTVLTDVFPAVIATIEAEILSITELETLFSDVIATRQPTIVLSAVIATIKAELTSNKESTVTITTIMESETVFPDTTPLSLGGGIYPNTPIPLSLKADSGVTVTKALDQLASPAISVTTATKALPLLVTLAITATTATTISPQLAFLAILTMVATYFTDQLAIIGILAMVATYFTDQLGILAIIAMVTIIYLLQQAFLAFLAMNDNPKDTWLGSVLHNTLFEDNNLRTLRL
ncbi:hypothetical protein MMC12_004538 [Toensbergia leucococca]|nr:hypothetical protein [Toensbergia leucococca]